MPLNKNQPNQTVRNIFLVIGLILIIALVVVAVNMSKTSDGNLVSPAIAVIPLKGEINVDTSTEIIKNIKDADKDITVSAIIFEIDSPGGTVLASKEIATAVKNAKKPTVAWIREVGASGAYWAASATDKIVADPASITGSIGVTGSYLQYSGLMEKYGVTYERLVSGQYKDAGTEYKDLTPAERTYLQAKIDTINGMFIDAISQNRNMPKETVAKLATGEIFLGVEAQQNGLVDVLGQKAEAQKTAEQLAGITNSRLVEIGATKGFWELMSQQMQSISYWIGKGIGDGLNPMAQQGDLVIKAEIN